MYDVDYETYHKFSLSESIAYVFPTDFQTPATPIAEGIIHFHHDLMFLLTFICFFVLWMLTRTFQLYSYKNLKNLVLTRGAFSFNYFKHKGVLLEIIWTIIPALILVFVSIPSFALLYATSSCDTPELTIKCVAHQWYWHYEITVKTNNVQVFGPVWMRKIIEESYLKKEKLTGLVYGPRLLHVTRVIPIPVNACIRLLVTSEDVLHSWAVPALGIKMDACPGRLNGINFIIENEGIYYGACSEICGVNHAFMPIAVYAVVTSSYRNYIL
jgi:heme/copper-type cytochrome/quinol oxidase subunit 2